jgi:hypothetical protein
VFIEKRFELLEGTIESFRKNACFIAEIEGIDGQQNANLVITRSAVKLQE